MASTFAEPHFIVEYNRGGTEMEGLKEGKTGIKKGRKAVKINEV